MNPEYLNTYFKIPHQRDQDLPGEFIIVTAFNPDGQNHSIESNQKFDADLAAQLQKKSLPSWRVIGGSHDFVHAEPSYAIETSLDAGIEIGIRFRQKAVFWINNGNLYLVDCSSHERILMGEWTMRVLAAAILTQQ